MNRRRFLFSLGAATAATGGAYAWRRDATTLPPLPPGEILGASNTVGHRLRQMDFPEPTETLQVPIVIVGGGVAGLSAGWKLQKSGFTDFVILELESEVGGNARSGENAITAYPWGAHYLPFPTQESRAVRELLADFGVLQGDPCAAAPVYDERYINFAPQERLYAHGVWHDGLWPQVGVRQRDFDQYRRFLDLMDDFQRRREAMGAKPSPFRSISAPAIRSYWRWIDFRCATFCCNRGWIRNRCTGMSTTPAATTMVAGTTTLRPGWAFTISLAAMLWPATPTVTMC